MRKEYLDEEIRNGLVDDGLVHVVLLRGHGAVDENFFLRRNLQIDVTLHATQQKRRQDL
jgi:hypothetical protein